MAFAFALSWQYAPAMAQEDSPLDPSNFTTEIAKKLAGQVSNPGELQKTMVAFVNSSPAPLMCKIKVSGVWEQVLRSQAGLENYKQTMIESRAKLEESLKNVPGNMKQKIQGDMEAQNVIAEKSMLKTFTKELTLTLDLVDTYCSGVNKLNPKK